MDPNTHSSEWSGGLDRLTAMVEELAAEDLAPLSDAEAARRVLVLRRLLDRLEGQWLRSWPGWTAAAPPATWPPDSAPP